jgi:hypothetical protein
MDVLVSLLRLLLGSGLTIHVNIIVCEVVSVLAIILLMFLVQVGLISLILGSDLGKVLVQGVDLLL